MTNPESNSSQEYELKKAELEAALKGKNLRAIFGFNQDMTGRNALNYALGTSERYAVLRWTSKTSKYGSAEYVRAVTIEEGETTADRTERVCKRHLQTQTFIFQGEVSKEDCVEAALDYLANYDYEEQPRAVPAEYSDEVVGLLDGPAGQVFVTGIGASIFGNHIRAMQEKGTANYYPLSGGSDS